MYNTANSEIARELSQSEKILWTGQPGQGFRLRSSDGFMIPFSLLWCGFAIFWESSVFSTGAPFFFKLWGVPFVLVGLYIVFGRFIVDAKIRTRTFYGVTTDRVIIVSGLFSRQTKSLQLSGLNEISLAERQDGSGTITFGPQAPFSQRLPAGWPGSTQYIAPAFEMIERAKETYDLIRQTQKKTGTTI
ncbi:MAG: PH domain-containing protein [Methylacidiphilales bacterium]|nr:PH domain-containing protein [Candidatus Methylacidiphilales bacterium]